MGANNADTMTAGQEFLWPEPELVEAVRQGIEAHKRNGRERNAARIAEILEYLRRPDANGD